MLAGAVTLVVWKEADLGMRLLGHPLYEIVPGFLANTMTILLTNTVVKQKDQSIEQLYEDTMSAMQNPSANRGSCALPNL
jgi:sodium/proline symporter